MNTNKEYRIHIFRADKFIAGLGESIDISKVVVHFNSASVTSVIKELKDLSSDIYKEAGEYIEGELKIRLEVLELNVKTSPSSKKIWKHVLTLTQLNKGK